jgi:hypothetical protein
MLKDLKTHPFYRPLWIRLVIVTVLAVWAVMEYAYGSTLFLTIVSALLVYCVWAFLLTYPDPSDTDKSST